MVGEYGSVRGCVREKLIMDVHRESITSKGKHCI